MLWLSLPKGAGGSIPMHPTGGKAGSWPSLTQEEFPRPRPPVVIALRRSTVEFDQLVTCLFGLFSTVPPCLYLSLIVHYYLTDYLALIFVFIFHPIMNFPINYYPFLLIKTKTRIATKTLNDCLRSFALIMRKSTYFDLGRSHRMIGICREWGVSEQEV